MVYYERDYVQTKEMKGWCKPYVKSRFEETGRIYKKPRD